MGKMAKAKNEKIRVHNRSKRDFTYPPAQSGGPKRLHPAGRAIELESELALKMIKAYPNDLIEFDSLVSGDKKDLMKENNRLESENARLTEKNKTLESEIDSLKSEIAEFKKPPSIVKTEDPKG